MIRKFSEMWILHSFFFSPPEKPILIQGRPAEIFGVPVYYILYYIIPTTLKNNVVHKNQSENPNLTRGGRFKDGDGEKTKKK